MPETTEVRKLQKEIRDIKLQLLCARLHLADAIAVMSMQPPPASSRFAHTTYASIRDLCIEQISAFEISCIKSFGSTSIMADGLTLKIDNPTA